uniref:Carboxylic ester hydrolase n=3 Tax=Meloidogyne TaxID=189290 RepID=A0A6V7V654_MELEN|nr:unnamed protein product [Meloidogyne enterolobii]
MAITLFWTFFLFSFLLLFTFILTKPTFIKKDDFEENVEEQVNEDENNDFPRVDIQTKNGQLRGFRIQLEPPSLLSQQTRYRLADIFLGIPFAQPPIEKLRLEKPLPPKNWNGTLDATTIPPACVPQHILAAPDYSEDCLYLNLFRPTIENKKRTIPNTSEQHKFPILVFIHGGGFCVGGTFLEGYNNIANNFVSQGIIVITIQYRLNFLGFFSDGTTKNPGNLGLWDQHQALVWIRQNVATFGGDPNRVTVWGQSAGSASTSILSISKYTRDLFHQSIQQSGSLFSPWALNEGVLESSKKTLKSVGCQAKGAEEECLKQIDVEDLVEGIQKLEMVRNNFAMNVYNPRFDNDFVPRDIKTALETAPKKPTMIGFTSHESMFLSIQYPSSVFALNSPLSIINFTQFDRSKLINFIHNYMHRERGKATEEEAEQIANELESFYLEYQKKNIGKEDWRYFLEQYTMLLSDVQFIIPILAEARLKAANNWPVFLYQFDHVNKEHISKLPFRGVVHAAEYPYLLGPTLFGNYLLDSEDDRKVQALLLYAYGSFVKNGVPNSPPGVDWPSLSSKNKTIEFIRVIKSGLRKEKNPLYLMQKINFWRKLSKKRGFNKIPGFPWALP